MNETISGVDGNGHLLGLLSQKARELGHSKEQLADALGISYQRLYQYERGLALIADAKKKTLRSISTYLGVPVVWVMLMAGHIAQPELAWPGDEQKIRIAMALSHMRKDAWIGALVPEDIDVSSLAVQEFVVLLYRIARARGVSFDTMCFSIIADDSFGNV